MIITTTGDTEKVKTKRPEALMPGDYRPMKSAAIEQKDLKDGCVLYDARKGAVYTLNSTASFVFTYCNGGITIEEIARQAALAFGLKLEVAKRDISSIISFLQEQELVGPA